VAASGDHVMESSFREWDYFAGEVMIPAAATHIPGKRPREPAAFGRTR